VSQAALFAPLAAAGARLIVSGFEVHEAPDVSRAFRGAGWVPDGDRVEDDWVGALFTSPTASTTTTARR